MKTKYAFGSMNFKNNLVDIQGPSHEQGGVSAGQKAEVEGGESVFDNFAFSDRLTLPDSKNTFSQEAKRIEAKYKKDDSPLAKKTKRMEMMRLAQTQEQVKQEMNPPQKGEGGYRPQGVPFESGNDKKKLFWGGVVAAGVPALVNMGRGLFEKPREFDKFGEGDNPGLQRMQAWEDIEAQNVDFDRVDLSEERDLAALNTRRARLLANDAVNNNASSASQRIAGNIFNTQAARNSLNQVNRQSFMNEENMNTQIDMREEMTNAQFADRANRFNAQGRTSVDRFNTQIGNQELMQNFQIDQINAANQDAQRELFFTGLGQLGSGIGASMVNSDQMNMQRDLLSILGPNVDMPGSLQYGSRRKRNKANNTMPMEKMSSKGFSF